MRFSIFHVIYPIAIGWTIRLTFFLGLWTRLDYNDDGCKLLKGGGEMVGSEDFAIGKFQNIFVTQGDLHTCFDHGSLKAKPGNIWFINVKRDKEDIRKVNLKGYPNAENFHPHGMYISNKTDLLYVTNHVQTYSGVEIFKIDYSNSPDTITLLHQHTVKSELFLPYAPNDVVEGKGKGELYVTMWLPFGYPRGGRKHPANMEQRIKKSLMMPLNVFGIKLTNVYYCTWNKDDPSKNKCVVAKGSQNYGMANGISINTKRTNLFVNDVTFKTIHKYAISPVDASLSHLEKISLDYPADNIEFMEDGDLVLGTMPHMYKLAMNDLQAGIYPAVPGGMSRIYLGDNGTYTTRHVVMHKGDKLSQISAATSWGETIYLGSPFNSGVLMCKSPQ